jgi:hypothetical protein
MSFTFLQEQGEESSAASFSDIPACVLSRLNLSAAEPSCKGSETDSFLGSRSGMMPTPSMGRRGGGSLMPSAAVSPAKTLAAPIPTGELRPKESKESAAGCGESLPESFVKLDPDSCSWKIPQLSLFGGLVEYSETWPQWGFMHDGECWALPTPAWITNENGSGFLPTPGKNDGRGYYVATKRSAEARITGDHQLHWIHAALLCGDLSKGWANPRFSELLMGWPTGWTDLRPLETDKFHAWLRSHGKP